MPETRAALTRRRAESNNARAAEPVAAALALLSPRGLGRLSCSSRLWRDAAAKVGAPLHVYAMSSHSSDLDGEGEHYGIAYLGQEPPPFDCCRGPSGGVLELYFKTVFEGVEVDRALQAEAKFTVPLLDRIPKVLHLNIWREIIRREHGLHLVG